MADDTHEGDAPGEVAEKYTAEQIARMRKLVDEADWEDIRPRLVKFAAARSPAHKKDDAEDVANGAIMKVLEPSHRWNVDAEPDLFRHLQSLVNTAVSNKRTSAESRRREDGDGDIEVHATRAASPETQATYREILESCKKAVVEKWGEHGYEYLLMVSDLPKSKMASGGFDNMKELSRVRENTRAFCRRVRVELGIEAKGMYGAGVVGPSGENLDAKIEAEIGEALEWYLRGGKQRARRKRMVRVGVGVAVVVVVVVAVVFGVLLR
jgi:hypothetical protein